MPGYTDVCVWIQSDKHEALKKALAERDLKLEDKLQEKLEEIYFEYVPQLQREDIAAKIEAEIRREQEEAAQRAAEQYRESVLKVVDDGNVRFWKITTDVSDVRIARKLRQAVRSANGKLASEFESLMGEMTEITSREFERVRALFLQGEKPAANAVTLDFDKELVTLAETQIGFRIYDMSDVSTAIYRADQAHGLTEEKTAERFCQRLAGKNIQFVPWAEGVSETGV